MEFIHSVCIVQAHRNSAHTRVQTAQIIGFLHNYAHSTQSTRDGRPCHLRKQAIIIVIIFHIYIYLVPKSGWQWPGNSNRLEDYVDVVFLSCMHLYICICIPAHRSPNELTLLTQCGKLIVLIRYALPWIFHSTILLIGYGTPFSSSLRAHIHTNTHTNTDNCYSMLRWCSTTQNN